METKEYFEKEMFFENLPSIVFTTLRFPQFWGTETLRDERM